MNDGNNRTEITSSSLYRLDSFDPGGRTGIATFILDWSQEIGSSFGRIRSWNTKLIEGSDRQQNIMMHSYLQADPFHLGKHVVLSEDFILDTFSSDRELLSPVRRNAVLEWHCQELHIPFVTQPREIAMSTATNERLQRWGFYTKQKDVRAAVKHGLTFIRRCHDDRKLRQQYFKIP